MNIVIKSDPDTLISQILMGDVFVASFVDKPDKAYLMLASYRVVDLETGESTTVGEIRGLAKTIKVAAAATLILTR